MIAGICIVAVCVIGLTGSLVTLCIARCNFKRAVLSRVQRRATKRIEANCPFIINPETGEQPVGRTGKNTAEASELNLRSLEEFFKMQYSMQTEVDTDSHRMSWV